MGVGMDGMCVWYAPCGIDWSSGHVVIVILYILKYSLGAG